MKIYNTKRTKGMLENKLIEKGIFAPDIMYICRISITSAKSRAQGKIDFKGQEIKKLKEHYGMTKEEAWDLFIEQNFKQE